MLKTFVGSFVLGKSPLWLHTGLLLEDATARKKEDTPEGSSKKKLVCGAIYNEYLWKNTKIYMRCIWQAASNTEGTICNI